LPVNEGYDIYLILAGKMLFLQASSNLFFPFSNKQLAHLFDNNCNAGIEVKYMSAKDFAACLDMPQEKKDYLKRYFT